MNHLCPEELVEEHRMARPACHDSVSQPLPKQIVDPSHSIAEPLPLRSCFRCSILEAMTPWYRFQVLLRTTSPVAFRECYLHSVRAGHLLSFGTHDRPTQHATLAPALRDGEGGGKRSEQAACPTRADGRGVARYG